MASKQQRFKQHRFERTVEVIRFFGDLVGHSVTYTIKPGVSSSSSQQRKLDYIAKKKNMQWQDFLQNLILLITCCYFFQTTGEELRELCPKSSKDTKKVLKKYSYAVNWFNQWSAELRKKSELDCTSEFEKFIRQNAFPSYDITNGFKTAKDAEDHVELIRNPLPVVIVSRVDNCEIKVGDEGETFPYGYDILRVSRRVTIFATQDHDAFMSCLEYGIANSTLVTPDGLPVLNGRRFFPNVNQLNGTFGDCSLCLNFDQLKINSSCLEIKSRLINNQHSLDQYNLWCKRRIISLINMNETLGIKVLFCGHHGCAHADGFIFKANPLSVSARMSLTRTQCPNGHAFCLRCFKPEHSGFCADIETDQQELLRLPNQKLCPTCKTIIFKDGGCNHMTCGRCRQDFCWLCDRKFSRSERYVTHDGCNQFDD